MGMFKVDVTLTNLKDPNRSFTEKFWGDTGALYSYVPEDMLEGIGIEPLRLRDLILADGRRERRLLGAALFEVPGQEGKLTCQVTFAPKGPLLLLGATALEGFGLEVDPTTKTLKPMLAVIGGFIATTSVREM